MISDLLIEKIVMEMARLSMVLYNGVPPNEVRGLAMILNHLIALLAGRLTIDDFHDEIENLPKVIREYYYELLFEEK